MAEADEPAKTRRKKRYVERPDIRSNLLDAAEALIWEDGYAAATARRIADRVGMKHQAVFYYFGSQDELLVEVFRRTAKSNR
jgi:AcrR family transcriptional regulator